MALVAFTMLALMAFAFVLAVVFFTFALVVALHALHELDAAQDEVLLLIESKVLEIVPSGLHFFAFGLHLSTFGFTFSLLLFGHFSHLVLALMLTFVLALVTFFAFVLALVLFAFLAARFGFTVGFALSLLGFHFGVHLSEKLASLLVQFSLCGFVHLVPLGIFSLQRAEWAVMFLSDSFLLRFFLGLLLRSVVASHHKEASKTHH